MAWPIRNCWRRWDFAAAARRRCLRRRAPSVPTLPRVLGAVPAARLQRAMARWFAGLVDTERQRRRCAGAAVDGKTSRASGVHVLNVFLRDVAQVIWQTPVTRKASEVTAFKEALDALLAAYPFLRIVTARLSLPK